MPRKTAGISERLRIGFRRYEDFVVDPGAFLEDVCKALGLDFDPGFSARWRDYATITGDLDGLRAGGAIAPLPRRDTPPPLLARLAASADYRESLEILGYTHPGD